MSLSGHTNILSSDHPATDTRWLRPENRRRGNDHEAQAAWPGSPACLRSEGFAEDLPEATPPLPVR